MASISPSSLSFFPTSLSLSSPHRPSLLLRNPNWRSKHLPPPAVSTGLGEGHSIGADTLRQFVLQNLGVWNGSLYQFDVEGNLLQNVSTRLSSSCYGEGELLSLIQTLYIKQAPSKTFVSDHEDEPEWVEYKVKETNMFTIDKYQQIGYFPKERAFSLRYQTAAMLETVLRAGVLGEDDIGEESPRDLRLPSRRPSVVCENCLYSVEENLRARAFHILDPKGSLEMIFIFLEQLGGMPLVSPTSSSNEVDLTNKLRPLLGRWEGRSITTRTGVYGATVSEAETVALLKMEADGRLTQDISSTACINKTTTNVHWSGQVSGNMISFDGGFQMILLPGGMYVGCPFDVSKSVARSQSFHLEFCWMESPSKRQRLVRTYDFEGTTVSSTYFCETKV